MRTIESFDDKHRALWGQHTVKLRHRLHEMEFFSEDSLAELIESYPPEHVQITTMAREGHDLTTWRHCDRAELPGRVVLEALRNGRIWINMTGISQVDARFGKMLDDMYEDLQECVPGFRPFRRKLGLLVSSPKAQVFYHAPISPVRAYGRSAGASGSTSIPTPSRF